MPKPSGESGDRPRVLFIAPEAPWPLHGGGAIRTASLIEFFAARAAVDIILFREAGASDPSVPARLSVHVHCIDLPQHRRDGLSRAMRNARRWIAQRPPLVDRFSGFEQPLSASIGERRYQLAIVEHFWCAPYVDVLRPACDEIWLDLHNIESDWHESMSRRAAFPARAALRTFARASRELERELLPRFDKILVPSDDDAASLEKITTHLHTCTYPNAIPFVNLPSRHEEEAIAFSGNLEYQPNIDAVGFFHRGIWPILRERHPRLRWRIIGRNGDKIARIVHGDDRIELTGAVEDAIAELAGVKVSVVPVRVGSGTRLKILEAWAAGTAVVSTSFGAQGLGAKAGDDIVVADEPHAFAAAVSELLTSSTHRLSLAGAGRRVYERRFTWQAAWEALASAVPRVLSISQSLYTG